MSDYSKYDEYLSLLDFRDVNPVEAEKIAEKCFHAQAWIVKDLAAAEYKELLLGDAEEVSQSEQMLIVPSEYKNAESRKAWVVTRPERKEAFQKFIKAKTSVQFLVRLLRLFENASNYYGRKAGR